MSGTRLSWILGMARSPWWMSYSVSAIGTNSWPSCTGRTRHATPGFAPPRIRRAMRRGLPSRRWRRHPTRAAALGMSGDDGRSGRPGWQATEFSFLAWQSRLGNFPAAWGGGGASRHAKLQRKFQGQSLQVNLFSLACCCKVMANQDPGMCHRCDWKTHWMQPPARLTRCWVCERACCPWCTVTGHVLGSV